jgi:RNA polymerase sigma factor (sigma-70 family)
MRTPREDGPGADTVIAAQRGDRKALDSLISAYLPLLYNIVGRAMNGHADVDDIVQETLLRVIRNISDLRDPRAFRSWLVAIAIRQVRGFYQARALAVGGTMAGEGPAREADFADLTILQLGLSSQRRETAEATRWLDEDDRDLLALWWQEAAGRIGRPEVAAALGLPPRHAAVRIARLKEQLATARIVVRALHEVPPCGDLAVVTAGWDHQPSSLWRKRVARHARNCQRCRAHHDDMVPAEQLLPGLPLVPVPAALAAGLPGHGLRLLRHLPRARHARGPTRTAVYLQPKIVAASVAVVTCAAAGAVAVFHGHAATDASFSATRTPPATPAPAASPAAGPSPQSAARVAVARPATTLARPPVTPPVTATQPAAIVPGPKKGVATWAFGGVTQSLAASGASWYFNWSASPAGIANPPGVSYVPMIWGPADVTSATLSQVKSEGHFLLGFNEPDLSGQSSMSVQQALSRWPQLMATGMTLGSPAVAAGAATPGGWLDQFMSGAAARGYRVNFITVHWYGTDYATGPAVGQLESYLQAIYDRYHLPIWLTEFALASFSGSPSFPTAQRQADFVTAAASMLQGLPYVQRYAWFALPANQSDGSTGLFTPGGVATETGRAFQAAGRP